MAYKLKDRVLLRQLQTAFNKKLFGDQNKLIGQTVRMNPAWIHQARLNYRYIFNTLNTYWPDWAMAQFSPYEHTSRPPQSELTCLNTTTRPCFSFFTLNNNHRADINPQGFVSFPYLGWGLDFKWLINDTFSSFFQSEIHLDNPSAQIYYSDVNKQKLSVIFQMFYSLTTKAIHITITLKNTSKSPISPSLHIGILPYTNEGIGGIRSMQYRSNQQLIINDQSSFFSDIPPTNILCTSYNDGNIFECSKKWDMIFSAQCHHFLASGLFKFNTELPPQQSRQFSFAITHSSSFITPLLFPFKKLNKSIFFPPSSEPHKLKSYSMLFQPIQLPKLHHKTPLIIQNFLHNLTQNQVLFSTTDLIFTVDTLVQLGAKKELFDVITGYSKLKKINEPFCTLNRAQTLLLNHVLVLNTLTMYRQTSDLTLFLLSKITHLFKKDSFVAFVKKLTIKKFNDYSHSDRFFNLFTKLFIYLYVTTKLVQHRAASPNIEECQKICSNFTQIIFNNTAIIQKFITTFCSSHDINLADKLFLTHAIFKFIFPPNKHAEMIDQLKSNYWTGTHCIDRHFYTGQSEKLDLLFSLISPPLISHDILVSYMTHTNSFGQYYNPKIGGTVFNLFPAPICNFHALFLASFFQLMCHTTNNCLHLTLIIAEDPINIAQLITPFGPISFGFDPSNNLFSIAHEFTHSPKQLILQCPPLFTHVKFSQKPEKSPIKNHCINIPLSESSLELFK
jgi:hypothetical protein